MLHRLGPTRYEWKGLLRTPVRIIRWVYRFSILFAPCTVAPVSVAAVPCLYFAFAGQVHLEQHHSQVDTFPMGAGPLCSWLALARWDI